MLEIEYKRFIFKTKEIWFSNILFDIKNYDVVVFRSCKNKIDVKDFLCTESATLIIDLTDSLDSIWNAMSKSSCRYAIKRAMRDGVTVKVNQNYSNFYDLNRSFRRHKKISSFNIDPEFMKKYGTLFTAEIDNEILTGQFYLNDENNMRWLLGASKRLETDNVTATLIGNANRLLIWEAIKYCKEQDIKEFDFGGYYIGEKHDEPRERINLFKRSFGGKIFPIYTYEKIYSIKYQLAKKIYNIKKLAMK